MVQWTFGVRCDTPILNMNAFYYFELDFISWKNYLIIKKFQYLIYD